jgi:drug/metabolite transporter (DMT)-like permease
MRNRAGLTLALAAAVISGFSVYINSYGVRAWGNAVGGATVYTTAKNLVAAVVLVVALAVVTSRAHSEGLTMPRRRRQWAGLAAIAVIGGSVPFVLFFEGLARVSSANAAFLQKTLVIWVALLAVPLLRERLTMWHVAAIGGLVWGQALLGGGIAGIGMGTGEAMIFAATLLWAVETIVASRLLRGLSALTVASSRMGGGVVILIGYVLATARWSVLTVAGWHQWSWAIATGLLLAAYVGTWYAALARAGAIDVTALLVPGAIITALLQSGSKALAPQWPGLALVAAGSALVLLAAARKKTRMAPAGVR